MTTELPHRPKDSSPNIEAILASLPHVRRGTGGCAAVLQDGKLLGSRAWGYANLERRIPMTTSTQFPICSISKQMVCLAYVSLLRDPTESMKATGKGAEDLMEAALARLVPGLEGKGLKVRDLCHMQSGIRDYWAMTTLWGSHPDGPFSLLHDAPKALQRIKSFHFEPGTEYSYSNVNFHVLGRILEEVSGLSLSQILAERVFIPAKMSRASLNPNTVGLPLPIVGYEGNEQTGFFAATNRIEWAGDAGIAASLEDMIAYEAYLDASLQDPKSVYSHNSAPQTYHDGTPAVYGYGLARMEVAGVEGVGHGGALRGFRHARVNIPEKRMSVVVLLNSEVAPGAVAERLIKGVLSFTEPESSPPAAGPEWKGDYLDPDTQLVVSVSEGPDVSRPGTVSVRYGPGTSGEVYTLTDATTATEDKSKLTLEGDTLHNSRPDENRTLHAKRLPKPSDDDIASVPSADYTGSYYCAESDSTFIVTGEKGTLYGSFTGYLGEGPIWLMKYVGGDVWLLGNPRGLDSTPPGDWTVIFKRKGGEIGKGEVEGVTVGNWLARKMEYERVKA
ncbi:hypothetical protein LTR95_016127 [Oleoguttula sp. CCFEE 5521]